MLLDKIFAKLTGRTTSFLIAFFIGGHVFHILGKLDGNYVAFMTAFMAIVVGHSVKEDYFAAKAPAGPTPATDDAAKG